MKTDFNDKLKEECAVFGASLTTEEAAGVTYNGLLALQHRGQEGAGIAVLSGNAILYHKNSGLVGEVFSHKVLERLPKSSLAVGHCRYSTTGESSTANIQPFVTEYLTGRIATAHNGNIINADKIRKELFSLGLGFTASSDSEVISSLIAYCAVSAPTFLEGLINAVKRLDGAFSLIVLSSDNKMYAVRDPNGYRPLCIGESKIGCVVASESCAVDSTDFNFVRDVNPGEIVVISNGKIEQSVSYSQQRERGLCVFEYVYFARPDSVIDGLSVFDARVNLGIELAKEHPCDADMVCGVPDSGNEAAIGFARQSGIPLIPGFFKNRYIGRSFILPLQSQRESAVKIKLNPLRATIAGKRIVLVDDSIVRGTTSALIIKALKSAGAAEVHLRISSPPFVHTCYFGTDIGGEQNLIACRMPLDDIRKQVGADSLGYISQRGMKLACKKSRMLFCEGCFTGEYGIEQEKLDAYNQSKKK